MVAHAFIGSSNVSFAIAAPPDGPPNPQSGVS